MQPKSAERCPDCEPPDPRRVPGGLHPPLWAGIQDRSTGVGGPGRTRPPRTQPAGRVWPGALRRTAGRSTQADFEHGTPGRSAATERGQMAIRIRHTLCASLLVLWWAPWGIPRAAAEPSEACRNLAARFARAPDQMDLQALATLGSCVSGEIAGRVGGTAPSGAPEEEAPPPPAQGSQKGAATESDPWEPKPSQGRQYGEWPPPAPWGSPFDR